MNRILAAIDTAKKCSRVFWQWINSTGGKEGILPRLARENAKQKEEIARLKALKGDNQA